MKRIKKVTKKATKKVTKKARVKKKVEPEKKTAETTTAPEPEKVFDVAKPGETLADMGSKPIITPKGAPVQDPMITPLQPAPSQDPKDTPPEDAVTVASDGKPEIRVTKTRIEPLHNVTDENGVKEAPQEQAGSEEPSKEPEAAEPTEPAAPDDPSSEADEPEGGSDNELDPTKQSAKTAEEIAAEKRQAEAEALIASKAYYLPVNSVKKRRSMRILFVVFILIVLLLAGGLYVLDAGLLETGITPPTDFIDD